MQKEAGMSGKNQKKTGRQSLLARAGRILTETEKDRKSRQKKWKMIETAAGALVILLNMWRDHKEAIIRKK